MPHLIGFANEDYAPLEALGDARVRDAILAARERGVDIYALFPDGADHVHIDVRPKRTAH